MHSLTGTAFGALPARAEGSQAALARIASVIRERVKAWGEP